MIILDRIKNYLISLSLSMVLIIILAFFINVLNYFDLLNNNLYKFILVITTIFSISIGSYILGTKTDNKGYLNGLIYGIITVLLFIIISFILGNNLSLSSFVYYLIIVIISSIGGSVGINRKNQDE